MQFLFPANDSHLGFFPPFSSKFEAGGILSECQTHIVYLPHKQILCIRRSNCPWRIFDLYQWSYGGNLKGEMDEEV